MNLAQSLAPYLATVPWLAAGATPVDPQLTLPPVIYAVPGVPCGVWFDNVVLTEHPEQWRFTVSCDLGSADATRWLLTPGPGDVGDHAWSLQVANGDGQVLATATARLHVARADAGAGQALRLLLVGDSATHGAVYPNALAALLHQPGNPSLTTFGGGRENGVTDQSPARHEGYGGWTWARFATYYEPHPDGTHGKMTSPFIFLGADGQPALDIPRYIRERCGGRPPDVVTFLLGANDCFGANPDDPQAIDHCIDGMFQQADHLLAAWRAAAPQAALVVAITSPGNSRESGFEANYHGQYHRWGWKRIGHRLAQREIAKFRDREAEGLYLLPTELHLDPVGGFPVDNGMHCNATGYRQIAESFYGWIKAWLEARR